MVGGLAFLVLLSASYEARAQGRGQRQSNRDKKCAKFVNCHDASEGRLDGRGPRRGTDSDNWNLRRSRHDRDSDRFGDRQRYRRHQRNRNSDRNGYWRHRDRNLERDRTLDRDRTWSRRGR